MVSSRCVVLAFLILAGCAAEGEKYDPVRAEAPGKSGVIYIYRPKGSLWGRGESPHIHINNKSFGQLKAGGYIRAVLPEGEYDVTVLQTLFMIIPTIPKSVTVAVVPGSRSYVRVDQMITSIGKQGMVSATEETVIEEVTGAVGQAELRQTRAN